MGVSIDVVRWLLREGHDAVHLREESLQRLADSAVFSKSIEEDRILLAFDLDFGKIAVRPKVRRSWYARINRARNPA